MTLYSWFVDAKHINDTNTEKSNAMWPIAKTTNKNINLVSKPVKHETIKIKLALAALKAETNKH